MESIRKSACVVTEMKMIKINPKERVCSAKGEVGQVTLLKREWRRVCLKKILQRSTQEKKEKFRVLDLSRSNWVSDLLSFCCFPAISPCVGSVLRAFVCYINLTVFSFQNGERISYSVREMMQREGVPTGHSGRDRSRKI